MRVSYQPKGSYIPPTNSSGNTGVDSSEITEPLIIPEETNAQNQETLKSQRTSENQRKENTANASIPTMVQSSKSTPTSGQEIDKVECEGAVKIQEGERLAVAEKVLYLAKASPRRLVLTGDARVWQGQNSITGHQITYYLDENRSLVDSVGSQRVRAFYDQGGRNN
jgi:lipopolysaccharide export system protein LptA